MRKIILAVCLVSVLLLAGCGPPITSGTVIGHKFVAAHTEMNLICADPIIYNYENVPDEWLIMVRSEDGKRQQWIRVTEKAYNKYKEGDHFELETK